jgi:hypothetical protein
MNTVMISIAISVTRTDIQMLSIKKRSFKRENKLNDTNNPNIDSDVQPKKQE